jgi:hypothetical protein
MNEARFIELLNAYGADLSRWPDDERGAAEALLEVAPHRLKDIWESERTFDHLLALEKDGPVAIALETRVLSMSPDRLRAGQPAQLFGRWAIAASLALGLAVGYAGEPSASANGEADFAKILTITGGGAGSVYLAAMADPES